MPSLLARTGLWRLTRHDAARDLYDRLESAGVYLAQLDLLERDLSDPLPRAEAPGGLTLTVEPVADGLPQQLSAAPVAPGDAVVLARREGATVGWCLLSDRPVYVPELHRRLRLPGSYLWRLYVRPDTRGEGVGTAVVRRAMAHAAGCEGVDTMSALVAPDNLPSRSTFRNLVFRPRKRYTSAGVAGRSVHRERPLGLET